jgi:cell division transport system permease protein
MQLHLEAARQAARRLTSTPVGTLLSSLVIGIALALPAGGQIALQSFLGLARDISGTPQISLFMRLDTTRQEAAAVEATLRQHGDLARVVFVSREEAFRRLHATEGLGAVLDALPRNPFPDAFVLTPRGKSPALFKQLETEFAALPKVEHVQIDSAWVARLAAMLAFGELVVLTLAALLGAALVVVTFNTIRLQILTQRAEIEVARLMGATDRFIRRPFYWFGALQGLLGGALAWAIVSVVLYALTTPSKAMAAAWGLDFALRGLSWSATFGLLAFAAALGLIGTALSVRQHLRDI